MRKTLLVIAAITSTGAAALADPIVTFKQTCLANPGNPQAIIARGNKAGFKMASLGKNSAMGGRKKTDESLQVNAFTSHKFECAVTTSDMANPRQVSKDFFTALGLKAKKGPVRVKIGGKAYTILHDTKGGEAFVIFAN